jgi:hypothetical protein
MGIEVCQAIVDTLNSGVMPSHLNMTCIALIPKVKNLTCVTEYRRISLCNVLYKLISKVLANRLKKKKKKIMHLIISPTQSAFILGRLITDNIWLPTRFFILCIPGWERKKFHGSQIEHE